MEEVTVMLGFPECMGLQRQILEKRQEKAPEAVEPVSAKVWR